MKPLLWHKTHKLNSRGLAPISLRITINGVRAELSTNIRVAPKDWLQDTQRVRPGATGASAYNDELLKLPGLATSAKNRLEALGQTVTAAAVVALLKNPKALQPGPAPCLLEFMEQELEDHYLPSNRATYEAVRAVVRKLRAWAGAGRLPVDCLPPARAQQFYRTLLASKARGGEVATANKAVSWLKALYNRGAKQHLWPRADNPFEAIDKKTTPKRQKVRLTAEELAAVLTVPLPAGEWLWRARAAYLLQFYLRGERIGACLLLRWSNLFQNDTSIRYQAQKGGPFKQVPVRPELAKLLQVLTPRRAEGQTFVLPYLANSYDRLDAQAQLGAIKEATAVINKALKEVARRAGVDKPLRSHAARHTFATVAAKAVGARAVQQMLGHTTLKMTETYLASLDTDEMDTAADAAFDSL